MNKNLHSMKLKFTWHFIPLENGPVTNLSISILFWKLLFYTN